MSTYLQLCIDTGRDSGLISSNNRLTSVSAATGKQEKIVSFVDQAYTQIQHAREDWRWMTREYSGPTVAGQARYTGANLGIARFSAFCVDVPDIDYRPHAIYDPALGASNTSELTQVDYTYWRSDYGRGAQAQDRPIFYAISPAGELCLGPIPDKVYTVTGEYRASPQRLVADADVPDMPESFHDIIKWRAIMLVDGHDGAVSDFQWANGQYAALFRNLVNAQTGSVQFGGSLA